MRFSVWPIVQQPAAEFLETCRHAGVTGWDGVWTSDHLMPSREPLDVPVLECFTTAAAVAATVPDVRVGTLVTSNTFRHPAVVAKMAATIGELSADRFVLGIGAGWQQNEHDAHAITLPGPHERLEALDEACAVIRALLTEDRVDHDGPRYPLHGAVHRPQPGHIPLLVGVKGDHALRIAARYADEWNAWGDPSTVRRRGAVLDRHCEDLGRDPATIRRSAQALLVFTDGDGLADPERWKGSGLPMLEGTSAQLQEQLGDYAEAGLDELIVPDFTFAGPSGTREALDRFREEVVALFRR